VATAPAPGDISEVTSDHPTTAPPRAALFRLVLACVLALMLLASVITGAVLFVNRHGATDPTQADREAAMAQTQQFVMRLNSYGPDLLDANGQMPLYRKRVTAVITPKFAVSFDKSVTIAEQSVKDYGLARTCAVYATGVEVIDSDSAQVLVAGSFSQTVRNKKGKRISAGEPVPYRLRVSLDKIGGRWLVDNYAGVSTGGGAQ
jgi:Mce-associated membrane protein